MRKCFDVTAYTLDEDLHLPAGVLATEEPRRDDARIVEDEKITFVEEFGQMRKLPVDELIADLEQAAATALLRRKLCDQFVRKCVVEFGDAHGRAW